ncbi:Chromate transporter [Thermogladius calderae 1633]|uniref:Chromate transporter n=1 Tax=Thermogladius calderae (strain DSM 22663 / VKM B-2946 / 1633) TaxID=1184251 RepID=I3TDF3_THEC1|nr:chromate transporter [Thermogladius calderae]AFK50791.1 Chromate transporter [Thermogladius calderae 1633]
MGVSLLQLFLEFMKIGFFMFGGGYGGIALLYKELVEINKWISEDEFVKILGIAESTPGPIAINSATYIGYKLGGIPGSILATMGVVVPPYLVILVIAMFLTRYMFTEAARIVFRGINSAVVALILYALVTVGRSVLVVERPPFIDVISAVIFVIAFALLYLARLHPIYVILASAGLSILIRLILGL